MEGVILARKDAGCDILAPLRNGLRHGGSKIEVFRGKTRGFGGKAQEIGPDQDLSIASSARPDPDRWNLKGRGDLFCQFRGNHLEYNREDASLLKSKGVGDHPFPAFATTLDTIAPEGIYGLRGQTDVTHHCDPCLGQGLHL